MEIKNLKKFGRLLSWTWMLFMFALIGISLIVISEVYEIEWLSITSIVLTILCSTIVVFLNLSLSIMIMAINWVLEENNDRKTLWGVLSLLLLGAIGSTIFYFLAKKSTKKAYNLKEIDFSKDYSYLDHDIILSINNKANENNHEIVDKDLSNKTNLNETNMIDDLDSNTNSKDNTNNDIENKSIGKNDNNHINNQNHISAKEFKEEVDIIKNLCGDGILSLDEADKKIKELKDKFIN